MNYTLTDIINSEITLEPVICIHCKAVGEVTFLQYVGDGQCGVCGKWQLGEDE